MKKTVIRFFYLLLTLSLGLPKNLFSQNVGIGIANPTRAKLELNGAVDFTTAIFGGESTGIGFWRNNPGIGFNNYYNGGVRCIGNGYSGYIYLDATNGGMYFNMNASGTTNSVLAPAINAMKINTNGYIGIGGVHPNAQLQLSNTLANRKIVLWDGSNNDHQYFGLGIEPGTMRYNVAEIGNVHSFYAGASASSSTLLMSIWGNKTVTIGDNAGGGKLGINTLPFAPATALEINGGLSLRTALISVAGNGTVAVGDRSFIVVFGTTPTPNVIHLANGISAGQLLILMGDAANQTVTGPVINDESNLDINGQFRFAPYSTITLIWTGAKWVELSRSVNT